MSRAGERGQAGASARPSVEARAEGLQIKAPKAWHIRNIAVRSAQFTSIAWTCDGDHVLAGEIVITAD
jgi:hypothetical protein